jgi:hypothetical protein
MATGQNLTHSGQCAIYKEQGGNRLVVDSSGELDILSGGAVNYESGATVSYAAGAYQTLPVQTLTSTQTATNATNFGLTVLTGTTTGPTYTLAAPITGIVKHFSMTSTSSGATHRAVLRSNSTGVSFDTTGGNQVTFATSALRGLTLVAASTAAWKITGVYTGVSIGTPRTT